MPDPATTRDPDALRRSDRFALDRLIAAARRDRVNYALELAAASDQTGDHDARENAIGSAARGLATMDSIIGWLRLQQAEVSR